MNNPVLRCSTKIIFQLIYYSVIRDISKARKIINIHLQYTSVFSILPRIAHTYIHTHTFASTKKKKKVNVPGMNVLKDICKIQSLAIFTKPEYKEMKNCTTRISKHTKTTKKWKKRNICHVVGKFFI